MTKQSFSPAASGGVLQEGMALQVLRMASAFQRQRGCAPTLDELRELTFASSKSVVRGHLVRLAHLGMVKWEMGKARTLQVTNRGRMELGEDFEEVHVWSTEKLEEVRRLLPSYGIAAAAGREEDAGRRAVVAAELGRADAVVRRRRAARGDG